MSQYLSSFVFALRFHILEHESIRFLFFLGCFGDSRYYLLRRDHEKKVI